MGNCVASSISNRQIRSKNCDSDSNLLRIIKMDGKVMEYRTSILVKDVILSFQGFGVGVLKDSHQLLSPDYELKIGRAYHLLPLSLFQINGSEELKSSETEEDGERMRVKVVLSKRQLHELLSMKISLDELILKASRDEECRKMKSVSWKAELETIIEGNESGLGIEEDCIFV